MPFATALRRLPLAVAAAVALTACEEDVTTSPSLAGTYRATTFRVVPSGSSQGATDVLAAGGSLTLTVARDNSTSGTLSIPPTVNGGTVLNASMAGRLVRTGNTVEFDQSADTFVRDLTFTIDGTSFRAVDHPAGSARFTITLSRE